MQPTNNTPNQAEIATPKVPFAPVAPVAPFAPVTPVAPVAPVAPSIKKEESVKEVKYVNIPNDGRYTITCPVCGKIQKSDRLLCFNCEAHFVKGEAAEPQQSAPAQASQPAQQAPDAQAPAPKPSFANSHNVCSKCHAVQPSDNKFCFRCGTPIQ